VSPQPCTLGIYTTVELARAAVTTRLRDLFGGGDCFTAPCALHVEQDWREDGTGHILLALKSPDWNQVDEYDGGEERYRSAFRTLTLSIEAQEMNLPPPLNKRGYYWRELARAVRLRLPPPPPAAAAELAARYAS
jgi:hypothetical protein